MADSVFDRIEESILDGTFKKGDCIGELKLCEMLGVSRTPVREALTRLRSEGLVGESAKGTVVLGVTREDLDDIYEVRRRIEGYATARAAGRITEEELKTLEETLDLQEFYVSKGQTEGIGKLDSEFHRLIYLYSGSRTLASLLSELHRKVMRYRRLSVGNPARAAAAAAEHREILAALSAHDAPLAEALAKKHIQNAHDSILSCGTDAT